MSAISIESLPIAKSEFFVKHWVKSANIVPEMYDFGTVFKVSMKVLFPSEPLK